MSVDGITIGTMSRIRLFGAAGGAVFAALTLVAFLIAPGPSSADGVTVVEYYTEHGNAAIWQAVLAGFGIVCFVWFAATFQGTIWQRLAELCKP